MKILYSRMARVLALSFLFITLHTSSKAQTTLAAGDIAFTGYTSAGTGVDSFSFVLLINISSGTVISFTDNCWNGSALLAVEQTVIWTSGTAMAMGNQVTISGPSNGAATAKVNGVISGSCTGTMPSLITSGDQILAYQGSAASPNFITGLHMNVYSTDLFDCANTTAATWDPPCAGTAGSACVKPPGLTTGVNAVWIGTQGVGSSEADNAKFTGCGLPLVTAAQVRAAVNNSANWTKSSGPPVFGIPSTCTMIGISLPVTLISFTGKLNPDKTISLQWKVAAEQNILQYIVEESADGINFSNTGTVPAGTGTHYALTDQQVFSGNNYYRLKIPELSGKINYSSVIVITLKAGIKAIAYPNPVADKLTLQQFETVQSKTAIISDAHGKVLQHIRITSLQQQVNMETYPPGIYFLKLDDGTVFNITKVNK
jgi:Secretion system C-terminal sorting domain